MTDTAAPAVAVHGTCPDRFDAVRQVFADHFAQGVEHGAAFAVAVDGELVIDIWSGFRDKAAAQPWTADTLVPVFSTTKAVAALLIGRLVGAGRLAYDQTVASVWPEFAQNGKAEVTVEQALSHQAGLAGFLDQMDPALWFDWTAITDKLAAMPPMWPVGSASGYHPVTFGFIAGEIFRRVDGRTMGTALREDLAAPLGLDLMIGAPREALGRVAQLKPPKQLPNFGVVTPPKTAAFLTPWAAHGGRGGEDWLMTESPASNGVATAASLARLLSAFACDGRVGAAKVLAPGVADRLSARRIVGEDLVLPYFMDFGAGVMRNAGTVGPGGARIFGPGERTFGHYGWGGSCAFADPDRRLSAAYVMNQQQAELVGDSRARALIGALYESL